MSSNNITTVREHLLATLADLRNRDAPMEIDRARAVADVARVLVDSAKVEVDYLRVTGQLQADFLQRQQMLPNEVAHGEQDPAQPANGISGITRHLIKG